MKNKKKPEVLNSKIFFNIGATAVCKAKNDKKSIFMLLIFVHFGCLLIMVIVA